MPVLTYSLQRAQLRDFTPRFVKVYAHDCQRKRQYYNTKNHRQSSDDFPPRSLRDNIA
jgi:hypothetical protein